MLPGGHAVARADRRADRKADSHGHGRADSHANGRADSHAEPGTVSVRDRVQGLHGQRHGRIR